MCDRGLKGSHGRILIGRRRGCFHVDVTRRGFCLCLLAMSQGTGPPQGLHGDRAYITTTKYRMHVMRVRSWSAAGRARSAAVPSLGLLLRPSRPAEVACPCLTEPELHVLARLGLGPRLALPLLCICQTVVSVLSRCLLVVCWPSTLPRSDDWRRPCGL